MVRISSTAFFSFFGPFSVTQFKLDPFEGSGQFVVTTLMLSPLARQAIMLFTVLLRFLLKIRRKPKIVIEQWALEQPSTSPSPNLVILLNSPYSVALIIITIIMSAHIFLSRVLQTKLQHALDKHNIT